MEGPKALMSAYLEAPTPARPSPGQASEGLQAGDRASAVRKHTMGQGRHTLTSPLSEGSGEDPRDHSCRFRLAGSPLGPTRRALCLQ